MRLIIDVTVTAGPATGDQDPALWLAAQLAGYARIMTTWSRFWRSQLTDKVVPNAPCMNVFDEQGAQCGTITISD